MKAKVTRYRNKIKYLSTSLLCIGLFACQEESDREQNALKGENQEIAGTMSNGSGDPRVNEPDYTDEEGAGTSMNESSADYGFNTSFEAGSSASGDSIQDREANTQTWQESEAAQRQAIVDVGGGNSLSLHSQRVSTRVEGHRARTIVDQVFYSPYERELEGTFRYSLPVGASVSYYALYLGRIQGDFDQLGDRAASGDPLAQTEARDRLEMSTEDFLDRIGEDEEAWGELRVGRVVSQADGREAYEDTTRQNIDPALVENVSPNAFQAQVFPIQPRGYTRIVFAYDEALERVGEELVYTFPLPEDELAHLSFELLVEEGIAQAGEGQAEIESPLPLTPLPAREMNMAASDESESESIRAEGQAWSGQIEGEAPGGSVILRLPAQAGLEVITGQDGETRAFSARLKLEGIDTLSASTPTSNERAIFVLDTSLSSQPTRFAINRQLLAELLIHNPQISEFAVIGFDLGAEWITDGFVSNTPASREAVLTEVDQLLLEGATRFDAVADAIREADWISENTDLFLLSDGAINWGTQAPDQVKISLSRIDRVFAYRTGVGAENISLYRALTSQGGVFSCLTMESLSSCATAHRSPSLRLVNLEIEGSGDQPASVSEIVYTNRGGDVVNGTELSFAAQINTPGQAILRLTLSDGVQEHELSYPLTLTLDERHRLAPRVWAELLVSLMSESGQPELRSLIHALSQRYTILTKEVVLLVLESDEEYERYDLPSVWQETLAGVDSVIEFFERALNVGAIYVPFIERVLTEISPQVERSTGRSVEAHLDALGLNLYELSLPELSYLHELRQGNDYSEGRSAPSDYGVYMDEAERLFEMGLRSAAARTLSSIVENDPANGVALRLVAYRLFTWGFNGLSAELFTEVLRRRPYEPQSYRDLAYVVREERPMLAAVLYEIALSGQWDDRFQQLNVLLTEEYSLFIGQLERVAHPLAARLRQRALALRLPNFNEDLRVIMSWNTDNVDIDLWVTDPNGFKCYYAQPENNNGGVLLDDIVQGFGPERFSQPNVQSGEYLIQAHYYSNNGNRLEAETFIHVTVIKFAGSDQEEVEEFDVLLARDGDLAEITRIRF